MSARKFGRTTLSSAQPFPGSWDFCDGEVNVTLDWRARLLFKTERYLSDWNNLHPNSPMSTDEFMECVCNAINRALTIRTWAIDVDWDISADVIDGQVYLYGIPIRDGLNPFLLVFEDDDQLAAHLLEIKTDECFLCVESDGDTVSSLHLGDELQLRRDRLAPYNEPEALPYDDQFIRIDYGNVYVVEHSGSRLSILYWREPTLSEIETIVANMSVQRNARLSNVISNFSASLSNGDMRELEMAEYVWILDRLDLSLRPSACFHIDRCTWAFRNEHVAISLAGQIGHNAPEFWTDIEIEGVTLRYHVPVV